MTNHKTVLLMGGDGIGPEVTEQGARVLAWFADRRGLPLHFEDDLYGGACFDEHGVFVRDETVIHAGEVDAMLSATFADQAGGNGFDKLGTWVRHNGIRGLSALGLAEGDFESIAEASKSSSSMRGNMVALSSADLLEILERSA